MIYFSIEDVFFVQEINIYFRLMIICMSKNISQICLNENNFNFDEQIYLTYLSNENHII